MVELDNLRDTKMRSTTDPAQSGARLWHTDSRPHRNQNRDQGGAEGRISAARHCGTLPN